MQLVCFFFCFCHSLDRRLGKKGEKEDQKTTFRFAANRELNRTVPKTQSVQFRMTCFLIAKDVYMVRCQSGVQPGVGAKVSRCYSSDAEVLQVNL